MFGTDVNKFNQGQRCGGVQKWHRTVQRNDVQILKRAFR